MNRFLDARIPLVFGCARDAGPEDAVLCEGQGEAAPGRVWFQTGTVSGHEPGCACCAPRNNAGKALGQLLLDRGRGTGPFFRRVIAEVSSDAARDEVVAALASDPLARACFRREAET